MRSLQKVGAGLFVVGLAVMYVVNYAMAGVTGVAWSVAATLLGLGILFIKEG